GDDGVRTDLGEIEACRLRQRPDVDFRPAVVDGKPDAPTRCDLEAQSGNESRGAARVSADPVVVASSRPQPVTFRPGAETRLRRIGRAATVGVASWRIGRRM